ncbi:hypothetical protein IAR55_004557 [Kwoniella newhampshirensis]|uniref:Uncharacterized protein n=1 Tax=Kwoniella newhampshirensis TaxID=1651941 RepID=A0AAW0YXI6_9TREE
MPSVSPSSTTSPKPLAPDPNINPFSALSPDLAENKLNDAEASEEMNAILGIGSYRKDIVYYSRQDMLRIGKKCRRQGPPRTMSPLETWFGLRRQPDAPEPSYGGQMGRFAVRTPGMRLGGGGEVNATQDQAKRDKRKEEEWRRPDRTLPRDPRRPNWQPREEDSSEPAWMDDAVIEDPAIAKESDPLIKFIPGEDMIAAHKRAMKSKDVGGDWRAEAFFGTDPAIASSSAPSAPPGFKAKSFNAADYLTQAHDGSDDEGSAKPAASAFTSRFQKFFGAPEPQSESLPIPQAETHEEPRDERMARLMGLLSTKRGVDDLRHMSSPPVNVSPNFPQAQYRPPNLLVQHTYVDPHERAPDPLQLLSQAQRQQQFARPPPHLSLSSYARPPNVFDGAPHDMGYPPFVRPPAGSFPNLPLNYPPPPQFFQRPPPPMPAGYTPRPPQYPTQLGPAQQDMLATLFSGLGPKS